MPVSSKATGKAATVGGIVGLNNKYYGVTVRHFFAGAWNAASEKSNSDSTTDYSDDGDFAFDSDEEEEISETEIANAAITSQGKRPYFQESICIWNLTDN